MRNMVLKYLIVGFCVGLGGSLALTSPSHAMEFSQVPTKIIIPSADISLEVKPAKIEFDTWEVRLDAVSFGESSTLPGNAGNTIVFSHAIPRLFGNLPNVEVNDTIHVFTDLDWFVYKVTKKQVVNPENIEVLNQVYPYQLTLYTCIGDNYSQRYVITAELQASPMM
ncbi:MAG: sortase [bacterium]|nr:sortase [bacterium]